MSVDFKEADLEVDVSTRYVNFDVNLYEETNGEYTETRLELFMDGAFVTSLFGYPLLKDPKLVLSIRPSTRKLLRTNEFYVDQVTIPVSSSRLCSVSPGIFIFIIFIINLFV